MYEELKTLNLDLDNDYEIMNKNLKDLKRSALEVVRNEENYGG